MQVLLLCATDDEYPTTNYQPAMVYVSFISLAQIDSGHIILLTSTTVTFRLILTSGS